MVAVRIGVTNLPTCPRGQAGAYKCEVNDGVGTGSREHRLRSGDQQH